MLKTLLAEVKQYKKASILTPVFMVGEVVMEILIPMLMAYLIDSGVEKGDVRTICITGGAMAVMAMLSLACGVLSGKYGARASSGFAHNLRQSMFRNIQTFSFSNIDKYSTAGLVTRMTTDVTNVQNAYQMILRMCTRAPVMLLCAMAAAFSISARLSLIFVAAIAFLGVALFFITKNSHPVFRQVFRKYDDLNASVQENVSAIRVVKAYVREDHETQKFHTANDNVYRLFVKAETVLALNSPVMQFTMYMCILAISWLGAHMIAAQSLTTGQLMSLFTYVMNILMSLMMLSMIFVMVTMARASADRIAEVLEEKADLTSPPAARTQVEDGRVDFDHVSFSYKKSGKPVLDDIDLHIRAGETIGIIGGTGSAKSSLVQLIPRLYDVAEGAVRVGGVDVRDMRTDEILGRISVVFQDVYLFHDSIEANIRMGKPDATMEEIMEAAKAAACHDFIMALPDGYQTIVGEGGSTLSGGEKQRISIARALLKDAPIVLLDEATASLDPENEVLIQQAISALVAEKTVIVIAHRLQSIMSADNIIVLEDGWVAESGTHEQLLARGGIYANLWAEQSRAGIWRL